MSTVLERSRRSTTTVGANQNTIARIPSDQARQVAETLMQERIDELIDNGSVPFFMWVHCNKLAGRPIGKEALRVQAAEYILQKAQNTPNGLRELFRSAAVKTLIDTVVSVEPGGGNGHGRSFPPDYKVNPYTGESLR